ncbi:palindromic element RPE5 domain-containing protein [Rickettsia sp. Oklahoma-10]|uniref:Palindromic element RPE5 domain-containing protein n=1 Tax=Rickettsia oklahomensis TaxID=3141789 RepID=A0AAU7BZM7_9RICK
MKSRYIKINFKKSNSFVSRGAEHITNVQHPRTYKDIFTNLSSSSSV